MRIGEGWLGGGEQEAWGSERDTDPTPLRRPKQFEEWGGSWPGRLEGRRDGSAGAGARAEVQPGQGLSKEELEQARKQRQVEVAARKLEKLGAQVGGSYQQGACQGARLLVLMCCLLSICPARSASLHLPILTPTSPLVLPCRWLLCTAHALQSQTSPSSRVPIPRSRSALQVFVHGKQDSAVDWGILAGYEEQKRQIEDSLLLALLHPGQWPAGPLHAWEGGPKGRKYGYLPIHALAFVAGWSDTRHLAEGCTDERCSLEPCHLALVHTQGRTPATAFRLQKCTMRLRRARAASLPRTALVPCSSRGEHARRLAWLLPLEVTPLPAGQSTFAQLLSCAQSYQCISNQPIPSTTPSLHF